MIFEEVVRQDLEACIAFRDENIIYKFFINFKLAYCWASLVGSEGVINICPDKRIFGWY